MLLVARCAQILGPPGLPAASASQNVVQNLPALLLGRILPKAQLGGLLFQWDATTTGGGAALGWEGDGADAPKVKFETKALISLSPEPLERPGRHIKEKGNSVRKRAEGARIIVEERGSYNQG